MNIFPMVITHSRCCLLMVTYERCLVLFPDQQMEGGRQESPNQNAEEHQVINIPAGQIHATYPKRKVLKPTWPHPTRKIQMDQDFQGQYPVHSSQFNHDTDWQGGSAVKDQNFGLLDDNTASGSRLNQDYDYVQWHLRRKPRTKRSEEFKAKRELERRLLQ